jgi:Domain of unknown function (DUF4129)
MRSLLAVWLISLLSLTLPPLGLIAAAQSSYVLQAAAPISVEEYWERIQDIRQSILQMQEVPQEAVRQQLHTLAAQWDQVTAVELADGSLIQIDPTYLTTQLRSDSADPNRLVSLLDALLSAHEEYPHNVFTIQDVGPLREILARPEFQWEEQARQLPNWLGDLYDWLINLLDRIFFGTATLVYQGRDLIKVAAVLVFLFALFFISRSLSRSLAQEAELAAEEGANDETLTSKGALKRAETLSMQGDYRNAVRYLYLSSLLVLDEQGLMHYDRSRTNREYLRSVSSKPELAKPLRSVIDVFDRVWYGFENVDEQTYQSYVKQVDELREKKE